MIRTVQILYLWLAVSVYLAIHVAAHKRLIRIRVSPLTCANNTENMIRDMALPRPDRI